MSIQNICMWLLMPGMMAGGLGSSGAFAWLSATGCVCVIGVAVFSIWMMVLLLMYQAAFKRCLDAARRMEATLEQRLTAGNGG